MADYISPEGLEKLKEELNKFKTEERQAIAGRLEAAKALGDLAENSEYQEAKEAQSLNEARIAELEEMLKNIVVIQKPAGTDVVQIGSQVVVERDGTEEIYNIVGSEEADPVTGKISNESPLGKSFLGKRRGDVIQVKTPAGGVNYKIKEIR